MNVRISSDQIRFRVNRSELDALKRGNPVMTELIFPVGGPLSCIITATVGGLASRMLSVNGKGNNIHLLVSHQALEKLADARGREAQIETIEDLGGNRRLVCQLEVDFKQKLT